MGKWGFELDDDEIADEAAQVPEPEPAGATLSGCDDAGIVTVVVSDNAVDDVWLAEGWRHRIDPRELHACVADAANVAIANGVTAQLDMHRHRPAGPDRELAGHGALTRHDLLRLIDAATTDIERRTQQAAAATVSGDVTIRSRGGHVAVTTAKQQVRHVELDPSWAARARDTEIVAELIDALAAGVDMAPTEAASSSAIDELTALIADPVRTLRRLGLPADSETAGVAR